MTLQPDGNWACKLCEKSYPFKTSLKRHIVNQHEENEEAICEICDKRFKNPDALHTHNRKYHRNTDTDPLSDSYYYI